MSAVKASGVIKNAMAAISAAIAARVALGSRKANLESPEGVALELMRVVVVSEAPPRERRQTRAYLLDAYAECLIAVLGDRQIERGRGSTIH